MAGKRNKSKKTTDENSLLTPPSSATKCPLPEDSRMQIEGEANEEDLRVYLPGMDLAEGEVLEVDPSAYVMLHELNAEWPCLSFDIIRDGGADERTTFPMSGFLVTGTQAERRNKNQLLLLKYTNLHKTQEKADDEEDNDDDDDDEHDDEDEEENDNKRNPRHYCVSIPHDGGINRIRSKNIVANDNLENVLTATWSDTGRVHIWDLQSAFIELDALPFETPSTMLNKSMDPVHSVMKHKNEGFALAWNPILMGSLLSGDCNGQVYLTEVTSKCIETVGGVFKGHLGSVEDLQWSPSESTVFASASCDKTVRIWDVRLPRHQSALSAIVHDCDVNVLSWNKHATHMLATGADDGTFATWDLRKWAPSTDNSHGEALSRFSWHQGAITSIEWSPHDVSVVAVAGADDQLTIWDFEVNEAGSGEVVGDRTVPPQLLFIHQGQKDIKELHWHPQLSGVLLSTALSGFNIFRTISV